MNLKPLLYEYYQRFKTFPSLTYLSKELNLSIDKIIKLLDRLVQAGMIKKIGNEYFFKLKQKIDAVQDKPKEERERADFSFRLVRYVMAGIAIISVGMSSFYSSIWFMNFLIIPIAIICAVTIVCFISFAFQASNMIDGKVKYVLRIAAIVMMLFSIVSTIGGQYRGDLEKKKDNSNQIKITGLELLKSEEKSLVENIESAKRELDDNTLALRKFKTQEEMKSQEYKNLFWKSPGLRKSITDNSLKLEKKREEIRAYSEKENVAIVKQGENTFYTWIASFLPFNPTTIEFWLYLFPAIFWDVLAPLGLHIFLKKEKEIKK